MSNKKTDEFSTFDDVMGKLLKVPHSELQRKLEKEKKAKEKKKQQKVTSSLARVSSKDF